MNKIKRFVLLLGIILPTTFCLANSEFTTENDGVGTIIINKAKNDSDVEINILNVYGKMVKNVNISKQLCGSHSIDLDISKLPEGIYYGIIKPNNNDKKTIKIIKH